MYIPTALFPSALCLFGSSTKLQQLIPKESYLIPLNQAVVQVRGVNVCVNMHNPHST